MMKRLRRRLFFSNDRYHYSSVCFTLTASSSLQGSERFQMHSVLLAYFIVTIPKLPALYIIPKKSLCMIIR